MKLGVIADDFTGASDIGSVLANGGMRVTQFVGRPSSATTAIDIDAAVIALKIRSGPVDAAVAQAEEACDWLMKHGCAQIIYKICSTFDSTPEGNIGPVAEALGRRLGETHVPVCPAFPDNNRTIYQGHIFVGDCLCRKVGWKITR